MLYSFHAEHSWEKKTTKMILTIFMILKLAQKKNHNGIFAIK